MNILMITVNDPAGMAIAFTNALNRYTEHTCRLITLQDRYGIDFGKDIHLPDIHDDDFSEVEHLLKTADLFHFHMLSDENMCIGPLVVRDYIKGKAILHHHHGHPDFLINAESFNEKYKRLNRKVIVSTPDLLKVAENSTWVPNIVPLNDVHYLPRYDSSLPEGPVKICQAPTRKFDKNFQEFNGAVDELSAAGYSVQKVIIERISHLQCLEAKKRCHIVFDHMRGWFGISSLESLAQGKPVIAGLDDWNISYIKEFTGAEELPWQRVSNENELKYMLSVLVQSSEIREEIGRSARRFMEDNWKEQDTLSVLIRIYNEL